MLASASVCNGSNNIELASGSVSISTANTIDYFTSHSVNTEVLLSNCAVSYDESMVRDTLFTRDTSYHHLWKRATIWSACLPGAGQIYNELGYRKVQNKKHRAWWKVPIIYGALGATGYYFYNNLILAQTLKTEWLYRDANAGLTSNPAYVDWLDSELIDGKIISGIQQPGFDLAAKRRDMLAFGFLAIWGLQTAEALVDGHFVNFDVSEDLSLSWSPVMMDFSTPGISLQFHLN